MRHMGWNNDDLSVYHFFQYWEIGQGSFADKMRLHVYSRQEHSKGLSQPCQIEIVFGKTATPVNPGCQVSMGLLLLSMRGDDGSVAGF